MEVTPQTDITVAVTDPGNITYVCTVPTDAQPEWAVDTFQLVNPEDMIARQFAATGIYIEIVSPGVTRLVITPEGRDTRLMQKSMNTIVCRCTGIRSRDLEKGDTAITVSVTTYSELYSIQHVPVFVVVFHMISLYLNMILYKLYTDMNMCGQYMVRFTQNTDN